MTAPRAGLWVAAAEPSGDRLLARVVRRLRERRPELVVGGFAGPATAAAGATLQRDLADLGVVGLWEALAAVPRARRVVRDASAALGSGAWGASLTVDAPSLLLRVAGEARRHHVPAIHLVAPQVWAWRPGRVRRVARSVDTLLCLLPFEPSWFEGHVRAVFVGHPAAAVTPRPVPRPGEPTIALCPGSRAGEVAWSWPLLQAVAARLRRTFPRAGFLVPVVRGVGLPDDLGPGFVAVDGIGACAGADAAVVVSGTATLELAALDVPMVVVYRVHPLSAALARRLLTIPHVALPNVLADRRLVPEHLQDLDPDDIAADVASWVGLRGQVPRPLVASLRGESAVDAVADELEAWV